jgi:effector-binding domain-containing protein
MLDKMWAFLRRAPVGLHEHGHNIMLYKDDTPRVEVGVRVTASFEPAGDVVPSVLPSEVAACATHAGAIGRIGDTHAAVGAWCHQNGHRLSGERWEVYGDPDPVSGDFTVEVCWTVLPG